MGSRTAVAGVERGRGSRALVWSALTLGAMAIFGSAASSPFQPELARGGQPSGPLAWFARGFGLERMPDGFVIFLGVIVVIVAAIGFLRLLREAIAGNVPARHVLVLVIAAHVVLLFMPLVYSRDVYSYAMYGRIVTVYEENPYLRTPVDFGGDPLVNLVGEKWLDTPPVYGPAFVSFSALVARFADQPIDHVNVYRLMAIVASLATVAVIVPLVRRHRPDREAAALVAFGANPVILFHSVASGHNDLLVALSIAGALALVVGGHRLAAVAVLSVGALVKATAGLPLLLLLVWCVAREPPGRRLRALGVHAGLVAVIAIAFAIPYWQLSDPTLGMLELAGHTGWLAPSVFLTRLIEVASLNTLGWLLRLAFALALLVGVVAIAREVWRRAPTSSPIELGASWGWALVLLMVLGPVLLPWYVSWTLPLIWLLPRAPRTTLLVASVALGVSLWSTEPERSKIAFDINLWIGHWIITPVVSVLVVRTLMVLRAVVRDHLPFSDLSPVPSPAPVRERVAAGAGEG